MKRLAEIKALAADGDQWTAWRIMQDHVPWLIEQARAASEALAAADVAFGACEVAIDNDGTVINRNALEGIAAYRALRGEGR